MTHDHLIDESETVQHIAKRAESYLHIARRIVIDMFGRDAGHEQVLIIAQVAAMMADLETAEILASSQDKIAALLQRLED